MQDFFDNAEPRTVAIMLFAIVFLVCAVEVTYLLWPQVVNYKSLRTSHETLTMATMSGESMVEQLVKSEAEVDNLSRQLHGDMARLPIKQMESFIIGRLQKVSWATEVELVSVQPGDGGLVQNFRESLFEVRLSAGYFDFFEWLQIINDELGYIVVKKFEIDPNSARVENNPKLDIALTLVSYRVVTND